MISFPPESASEVFSRSRTMTNRCPPFPSPSLLWCFPPGPGVRAARHRRPCPFPGFHRGSQPLCRPPDFEVATMVAQPCPPERKRRHLKMRKELPRPSGFPRPGPGARELACIGKSVGFFIPRLENYSGPLYHSPAECLPSTLEWGPYRFPGSKTDRPTNRRSATHFGKLLATPRRPPPNAPQNR